MKFSFASNLFNILSLEPPLLFVEWYFQVEPKSVDTRSGLLDQIKKGRDLKKVKKIDKIQKRRQSGIAGVMEAQMEERFKAWGNDSDDAESDSESDWSEDE